MPNFARRLWAVIGAPEAPKRTMIPFWPHLVLLGTPRSRPQRQSKDLKTDCGAAKGQRLPVTAYAKLLAGAVLSSIAGS